MIRFFTFILLLFNASLSFAQLPPPSPSDHGLDCSAVEVAPPTGSVGGDGLAFDTSEADTEVLSRMQNFFICGVDSVRETLMGYARNLFFILATISFVWTFGFMVLRRCDIGELFTELIKIMVTLGFFFWLLNNGPDFARAIINSLVQVGATAGEEEVTTMSTLKLGFEALSATTKRAELLDSFVAGLAVLVLGAFILFVWAAMALNLVMVLVSGWIVVYAAIFFLGFGAHSQTREMAITYFKNALAIGVKAMGIVFIISLGEQFFRLYIENVENYQLKDFAALAIAGYGIYKLSSVLPEMLMTIVTGFGIGGTASGAGGLFMAAASAAAGVAGYAGSKARGEKADNRMAAAIKNTMAYKMARDVGSTVGGVGRKLTGGSYTKAAGDGGNGPASGGDKAKGKAGTKKQGSTSGTTKMSGGGSVGGYGTVNTEASYGGNTSDSDESPEQENSEEGSTEGETNDQSFDKGLSVPSVDSFNGFGGFSLPGGASLADISANLGQAGEGAVSDAGSANDRIENSVVNRINDAEDKVKSLENKKSELEQENTQVKQERDNEKQGREQAERDSQGSIRRMPTTGEQLGNLVNDLKSWYQNDKKD